MAVEEREARAKLNMEHGFMQSIIRNQVDRDEYDKEQKLLKVQTKINESSRSRERPRRAARQVYVPPHLRAKGSAAVTEAPTAPNVSSKEDWETETEPSTETEQKPSAVQMKLEFERQDGQVQVLDIREGEDLKKLVNSFGKANGLEERLRDALYHRLSNAMKGRAV